MKTLYILPLIPLMWGVATAQMTTNTPQSFDVTGKSAQAQSGVQNNDPNRVGETPPPQLLGMELPLLDPSTDTISFNGGKFDVGNNAMVRERFEKYLSQTPDDTEASRKYRRAIEKLIDLTQKYSKNTGPIGSKVLVKIGMTLYDISDYPGDGQQSGVLASAMVSVLDAQRANLRRDKANKQLDEDIDKLVKHTNSLTNQNTQKGSGGGSIGNIQGKSGASGGVSHTVRIAHNTQKIAENKTKQGANVAANEATILRAKIQYQALLLSMFLERRFDHVVIGARVYRHLFRDGDTTLNLDKESDAYQMFTGISGMPPTVNALDSAAANARRDIDQSMDSIANLIAQNKLGEATNRLITAVAIGEFMQSVATFPTESRRRIAEYWTLRKNALIALNARDYDEVERISNRLKELDVDYNDSMLMSYTEGKKNQSNACLRKARKALMAGNEDEAMEAMTEASVIWPRNPEIKKAKEQIETLDAYDKEKAEFTGLLKAKRFRDIYKSRERLKVVMFDEDLAKQYEAVIRYIELIDNKIKEYRIIAEEQGGMGAGMAYEKLVEMQSENEASADEMFRGELKNDKQFSDALRDMRDAAGEFTDMLVKAQKDEKAGEYGSALAKYYRALELNPSSVMAQEGIKRVYDVIYSASF
ncbi:MAG: hypothetical protein E7031_01890 [Akkermansiaceae bacterium]|nr:hypothetical protein [Akkermansiaceae bacterium]